MGSRLSSSANMRSSPGWCKKGMWLGIPALVAGKPTRLAAYAHWKQLYGTIDVNRVESFQLSYTVATKTWAGSSNNEGENLALTIETLAEENRYNVTLKLRVNLQTTDSHTWANILIADARPFDTGTLYEEINEDEWYYKVRARG